MARLTSQPRPSCWSGGAGGVWGPGSWLGEARGRMDLVSPSTGCGDGLHTGGKEERGKGDPEGDRAGSVLG